MNRDRNLPTQVTERVKQDPFSLLAQILGKRLNRRGFLGTLGKGAAAAAAALGAVIPLGSNLKTALACKICFGCGPTQCVFNHEVSCTYDWRWTWGGPYYSGTCACGWDGMGTTVKAYAMSAIYVSSCPCNCYFDC
jgi:hypothetical protein